LDATQLKHLFVVPLQVKHGPVHRSQVRLKELEKYPF